MKKLFFAVVLLTVTVSAYGQKQMSKDDMFKEIAALLKTQKPEDAEKANVLAKDFMARFGKDKDDRLPKIKSFVDKYREHLFFAAIESKKNPEAFSTGKEILAEQPDQIEVLLNLAYAGYNTKGSGQEKIYSADSMIYAKKSIQLLESGTLPKSFAPFKDKDEAVAFMYFIEGNLLLDKDMKESVSYIYKAIQIESSIKNSALPYYLIASYYENVYAKLATELKAKVDAKKISDADFKLENERVDKVIDLMMDAYARAVKRGETEKIPKPINVKQRLTQVYKFRKKTDVGLAEYIESLGSTPMPDPAKF